MSRTLLFVLLLLGLSAPLVVARAEYVSRLPNGNNVASSAMIGHVGSGASLNAFGRDFDGKWTVSLCQKDSDGDGQTNGQELGDPCCVWSEGGAPPLQTRGLSNPGDRSSKRTSSALNITCNITNTMSSASKNDFHATSAALVTTVVLFIVLH
ncbi:hypothetical protein SDRG_01551 [Saprolegnia diclina VS20]|uniref:Temptin Cys/Cys disulfide domain-containing protein n=1 Tax=Saprolegnia diclina (strain VS20) TaxID=1156394 RepID=T0R3Q1_SAPDV|nr:hypothetical protein SDRG_01551 [Saprolegnia diclina VS20]EQC41591.1 hypothetical protein SDRG_01551 [Saprolegnia diclina VS20]|eukprot:XP_008605305.1 hypothetical protein SDRG_01551 [Saprolegnia diclina VS20]